MGNSELMSDTYSLNYIKIGYIGLDFRVCASIIPLKRIYRDSAHQRACKDYGLLPLSSLENFI